MKKGLLIVLVLTVITTIAFPSVGLSGHHDGWGYAGAAIGGLLLGTIIGSTTTHPVYHGAPPPAVYYEAPPQTVYFYAPPARVHRYAPPPPRAYRYHVPRRGYCY